MISKKYLMSLMAWFFAKDKKLDITRVMKMSLIHDIGEVYAGGMTPKNNLREVL